MGGEVVCFGFGRFITSLEEAGAGICRVAAARVVWEAIVLLLQSISGC